jgi:hypothetical protein
MKFFFLLLAVSLLVQGCASSYHSFHKMNQDLPWRGPFYGGDSNVEAEVKAECNGLAFSGPYAVRIHFEDTGEERTYICSEYPKYQ